MSFTIDFKSNTLLIDELLKQENISKSKKASFIDKLLVKKKEYSDLYFHTGTLDNEAIEKIKNAKLVIVNSLLAQKEVLSKVNINKEKIQIIYPAINIEYKKPKEIKEQFCQKHQIDSKKKIIFFTGKNLKSSGVIEFINITMQLTMPDIFMIIAGDSKQIYNLKFQLSKYNLEDRLLLLEDYSDINELFLASDIFLLPTHNKSFATNVLKAMFCKCVVFTTANNAAKELIDVFSTMENPTDRSIQFKLEAILQNKEDMKLIKKQNRKVAKEYSLENQLQKFNALLETL
ncbi:hypothetical protein CRV08_03920 [Halarcobacter ebronensis]|uniref:Glycosyl transferase family 1 domain-containing protein n=1 Tax=Halarcobacter ebronensis TaxID=1462615 RepID=A0A4Q0YG47_9BACT|nr:glycosyltransferase family 4 protein [Halarcobacter ebronensis]RXJ69165.1 hypothetical protein CRV08_03920 [Halarcobacter ebronensis]